MMRMQLYTRYYASWLPTSKSMRTTTATHTHTPRELSSRIIPECSQRSLPTGPSERPRYHTIAPPPECFLF